MVAEQLYQRLMKRGLLVTSEDSKHIAVSPAHLLTNKDREQIHRNKAGLLKFLAGVGNQSPDRHRQGKGRATPRANGELAQFRLEDEEVVARRYRRGQGRVYGGRFALDCETEVIEGHMIPRLALVSVSDGKTHYLIHPDDLGVFLLAHTDLSVVFHNAAFDFWVVHEHLSRHKQRRAAAVWMENLRYRRLHDTMLLEMLVRLADGTENRPSLPPHDLGEVADQYVGVKLDKDSPYRLRFGELIGANWSNVDSGFFAYALPDAMATARAYPALRRRGLDLMKEYGFNRKAKGTFEIDPAAIRKFGVLTEAIQVAAAIALAKIERIGMHTDRKRLARTTRSHSKNLEKLVDTIKRKYPRLFRTGVSITVVVAGDGAVVPF
jgi:hypothetical protein